MLQGSDKESIESMLLRPYRQIMIMASRIFSVPPEAMTGRWRLGAAMTAMDVGGSFSCRFPLLFPSTIFAVKTQKKLKTVVRYGIIIV